MTRMVLAGLLAAGLVAPAVHATSVGMPEPLVELLARGEPLPSPQRLKDVVEDRYVDRLLEPREVALLRALAVAQATDDPAPFREALRSGIPWIACEALGGLSYGRLAYGNAATVRPLEHVRAHDAAFVAGLLPEIAAVAKSPPGRMRDWHSTSTGRAAQCLALLVATTRVEDVRTRALDALVAGIVETEDVEALDALGEALEDGRAIPLSDAHRTALRPGVERHVARRVKSGPPHYLGTVAGVVDVSLIADADRRSPPGRHWTYALVKAGHEAAIEETRQMARSSQAGERDAATRVAPLVVDAATAPVFAAILAAKKPHETDAAKRLIAALEKVGARDLLEAQVVRDLRAEGGGHLPESAEALVRIDPTAADRLRAELPRLPEVARAKVLCALVRSGRTDLVRRAREMVDGGRTGYEAFSWALRALGAGLARDARSDEDFLRLDRVWESHPVQPRGPGVVDVDAVLGSVLRSYDEAGRLPRKSEAMLVAALRNLTDDAAFLKASIAETLGALGGPESEKALRERCAFDRRARYDRQMLRIACREAVGHIESRTGR